MINSRHALRIQLQPRNQESIGDITAENKSYEQLDLYSITLRYTHQNCRPVALRQGLSAKRSHIHSAPRPLSDNSHSELDHGDDGGIEN